VVAGEKQWRAWSQALEDFESRGGASLLSVRLIELTREV
jgi:hypothetical protein